MSDFLATLRSLVGPAHVLTEGDLTAYERDWRGRLHGKALAVVRPANTDEVAAVVRACAAFGVPMVPQGGNTSLSVGSTPDTSGREVVLSLTRMNAVRDTDLANLTMTVDAGCVLQNVQAAAEAAGLLKNRMYTYRWVSLMVWLYFIEGVVRAWGDPAPSSWLALAEVFLCIVLFAACAMHVRLRLRNPARLAEAP